MTTPLVSVGRESGLPNNQVHDIGQDEFGRLWLAGPCGLSRFDGTRVRTFDSRDGLRCAGLRSVAIGADSMVWLGTDLGLEGFHLDTGHVGWVKGVPWIYGLVESIQVDGSALWLGTPHGVVQLLAPGTERELRVGLHLDVGFVNDIALRREAVALVASAPLGLVEIENGKERRLRDEVLRRAGAVSRVVVTDESRVLLGTESGLLVLDPDDTVRERLTPDGKAAEVTAIATRGSHWWVAYGQDLVAYECDAQGRVRVVESTHCASRINAVHPDRLGNVWIGTDSAGLQGLSCLREVIRTVDAGHGGAVFSIKPEGEGSFRVGGDGFDSRLRIAADGHTRAEVLAELSTTVWDSAADPLARQSWLATHAGLYRVDADGRRERFTGGESVLEGPCRVLLARGAEWFVGTLRGLARMVDGVASEVRGSDGASLGYVYTMMVDSHSRLWVGTLGRGLWRESPAGLEPVADAPLSESGNTYAVAASPDGASVLVIQNERLVLLEDGRPPRTLAIEAPVGGWGVLWLDDHNVAIASSDGLRLMDVRDGHVVQRINALLGASAWEFTNNRTLARGSDGRLYCGVSGGLVAVDLERLREFSQAPEVKLSEVEWKGVAPVRKAATFTVAPGKWSFDAAVFACWPVDAPQIRFQFRLVGFEDDWTAPSPNPVARYSSLPPGRYALEARAVSPLGGTGEVASVLRVDVQANALVAGFAHIVAFLDRFVGSSVRSTTRLARSRELQGELEERTAALRRDNEGLKQSRDAYAARAHTDALTGLGNRRHFDEQVAQEVARAKRSKAPTGLLIVDVDDFKKFNDRFGHPAGDECLRAVAQAIRQALRPYDSAFRYGGEEFTVLLPGADSGAVATVAERLCRNVRDLRICLEHGEQGQVTVSAGGVASLAGNGQEMLAAADEALYRAKNGGRNRFVLATEQDLKR